MGLEHQRANDEAHEGSAPSCASSFAFFVLPAFARFVHLRDFAFQMVRCYSYRSASIGFRRAARRAG